ncbi:MAG: MerC family mercury resistance protein, partial [Bacteroidota bacterium]
MNSPVATPPVRSPLDLVGIVLSVLCVIHCLALPLIATGALAWAASESVHLG